MVAGEAVSFLGGAVMVRASSTLAAALVLFCMSCTDITEYSLTVTAGVNLYDPDDLTYLGSFPTPELAKSMFILNDHVYFTGTDGYIRSYDTVTRNLLEETMIGAASSVGYGEVVYNPLRNSIYVAGSTGNILEVSLPGCEVTDQFSVCALPTLLEVTTGSPGYLWVVDGVENEIHQVHLGTNGLCGSLKYSEVTAIRAIEASIYPDSLLVGTSRGFFRLSALGPGNLRSAFIKNFFGSCNCLSSIPGDSNFVTVYSDSDPMIGGIWVYTDNPLIVPPPRFYNAVPINGSYFMSEAGMDSSTFYVLSSDYSGTSTLSIYHTGENFGIYHQVEVPGNPLDIEVSGSGEVYVLTYQ